MTRERFFFRTNGMERLIYYMINKSILFFATLFLSALGAQALSPPHGVSKEDFQRAMAQARDRQIVNRAIYEAVRPSTVQIIIKGVEDHSADDSALQLPFRGRPQGQPSSIGSGFIIDATGLIVTNRHVIGNATSVDVKLSDGRVLRGLVRGFDGLTDIALVQLQGASDLKPVIIGDSERVQVGDSVVALGNPFGLDGTLSTGVVSAVSRAMPDASGMKFIQTDAAINPGNSGGPLINLDGEVIGINSMILSPTGASVGLGFAIPINEVKKIIEEIRLTGTVTRPFLGILIEGLTAEGKKRFGVSQGVIVTGVFGESGAAAGGIRPGDVVTKIDDRTFDDPGALSAYIKTRKVGDRLTVEVVRKTNHITLAVTLGKTPAPR